MSSQCDRVNLNCAPDQIMAAANASCSMIASPDGYSAEKAVYQNAYNDLINNFGYEIDYYLRTVNLSGADLLYGEEPTAIFYGPIPVKMYMELENESLTLQKFGFDAADDFTGYVHIDSFSKTVSGRDFFIQTEKGDILPFEGYVDSVIANGGTIGTQEGEELILSFSEDVLSQLYGQTTYEILNKFIETNHGLEPKSGDLIDFVQLGCDRPGNRCSKIFEITERMDQDIAGGLNPMLGHYIWRLRAKRYESSFEPGAPIECGNEQVYDSEGNGVIETNIPSDTIQEPKTYDWNIDQASKDIYDMNVNNNDIYGSYY